MTDVRILPPAAKYLKKLKDKTLKTLYKQAIYDISNNPYIGDEKKGDLHGIYGYDIYYNKTNYELAYTIQKNDAGELIIVIMAGTRENFYSQLKNYWN